MSSLQASRTLVKSPPELWAELSDLGSLARHLGEFGDIRITKVDPESRVEWEADRASGTVRLEPSGWGTRVVLTVDTPEPAADPAREPAPGPPAAAEEGPAPVALREADPVEDPAPIALREADPVEDPAPIALSDPDPVEGSAPIAVREAEPERAPEPEPEPAEDPVPEPKRGFWARLLGRKQPAPVVPAPEPEPVAEEPEPVADEAALEAEPEDRAFGTIEWEVPEPAAEPEPEPEPAAPVDAHAVLNGVLDTLGAAHHRPFSRP
jgi:hypothetical protein